MNSLKALTTKQIVTGGVLLALSIVTLMAASMVPGIELTLYALSSVYVAIIVIEFSANMGWVFYFASVMLSFIIVPNKFAIIPYTVFFGLYAIIKYYIETFKKINRPLEILAKLLFCNLMLLLILQFFTAAFTQAIHLPELSLPVFAIGIQVFFLVYDFLLTLIIGFYRRRRPKAGSL